jgi:hypothetical protein
MLLAFDVLWASGGGTFKTPVCDGNSVCWSASGEGVRGTTGDKGSEGDVVLGGGEIVRCARGLDRTGACSSPRIPVGVAGGFSVVKSAADDFLVRRAQ